MTPPATPNKPTRRRPRPLLVIVALAILGIGIIVSITRENTPLLTNTEYEQRLMQWNNHRLGDYSMKLTVNVSGRATEHYALEVRAGKVSAFSLNGLTATNNDYYSINGLFEILAAELENTAAASGQNQALPSGSVLRASFDETYGYPRVFKRLATQRKSCFIYVTEFEPMQ